MPFGRKVDGGSNYKCSNFEDRERRLGNVTMDIVFEPRVIPCKNSNSALQARQAGFAGTRVKSVKLELRYGVCSVRQPNILLALNEIAQR